VPPLFAALGAKHKSWKGDNVTRFAVEKEIDGTLYRATAKVEKEMLSVSSVTLGTKHAKVSSSNEVLALMLLQELINDHLRKG
jgi:hypothetical protein